MESPFSYKGQQFEKVITDMIREIRQLISSNYAIMYTLRGAINKTRIEI